MGKFINLDRKFWPVEADKENDPESIRIKYTYGFGEQLSWNNLLEKKRVVIIAEPGTGKTEEFRAIARRLRSDGKLAFFCRIELLNELNFRDSLDIGTVEELEKWSEGKSEAYFFLDSVDEARLTKRSAFDVALRRFASTISGNINRAKVFVSCRVSNWRATADLSLFIRHLPIPNRPVLKSSVEASHNEATNAHKKAVSDTKSIKSVKTEDHTVFQLSPLNERQIEQFASQKGVEDTKSFTEAIKKADVNIFAERPQDLLDLIAYWKSNSHLGGHSVMLEFNIQQKLEEHDPKREDLRPLSAYDSMIGAERLAAAITLQKRNTIILPDSPIDDELRKISIDPKESLSDWTSDKIHTILDRAIFDEAIYGTVCFHHRSVREYLTATWLRRLIKEEKSRRSIENLLFSNKYGRNVVIPSMRPIAAWLALWDDRIKNNLQRIAPEVLIENGDPASLPIEFRKSLLIGFAEHYANQKYTGTTFDLSMIRRLADLQLAPTINYLLRKFGTHDDVCTLLLKIIRQGQISESVDIVLSFVNRNQARSYTYNLALQAISAAGTIKQQRNLVKSIMADLPKHGPETLGELCSSFFPSALSVTQLLKILKIAKSPEQYSMSPLQRSIDQITSTIEISDDKSAKLLQGLHKLIKQKPFIERRHCEVSKRYVWLLQAGINLANQFIQKRHPFSFDPKVLDLFLCFALSKHYSDISFSDREDLRKIPKSWPEFTNQLFWHAIANARIREQNSKNRSFDWWHVKWEIQELWTPDLENLEILFENLDNKTLLIDRAIALEAIFEVYVNEKRPRKLRERMKKAVAGKQELESKLHGLFHPKPLTIQQKRARRQHREFKKRQEKRETQKIVNRENNRRTIIKAAAEIINVGNAKKGEVWQRTAYLYDRIRDKRKEGESGFGYANWRALEEEFGPSVAQNFRDGCIAYWREYDPFSYLNRRVSNTIPWPRIIGLTGLAMESIYNPDWSKTITRDEALIAAHYSVCELSGFPSWFDSLQSEFSDIVDPVIEDELRWELHEMPITNTSAHTLQALRYSNKDHIERYKSVVFKLISIKEPGNDLVLDHSLSLILSGNLDAKLKTNLAKLSRKRFKSATEIKRKYTWLVVTFCIDGLNACSQLQDWVANLPSENEKKELMVNFCAALMDHGNARFGLTSPDYEKIEVLAELVPLIYNFVRVEDDNIARTGVYTPGTRDHAQETRSRLLNVIFDTPGRKSYDVLVNLSKSVSNSFSKDRMDYLAKERAAIDAEQKPWTGSAVAEFSLSAMRTPRSQEDLFHIALARLDDLKLDIEEGDESEAVYLRKLKQETEVRTVFANRLRKASRSMYTIGSEEELADAKRTDIRFNAPQVYAPVPVELKIAGKWSFRELRERLESQLVKQYMRVSQYGIFLLVHNSKKNRRWRNSYTHQLVDFDQLIVSIKREVENLKSKYLNVEHIEVVGIDFTKR
jgi:hypothetical protein